MNRRNFSLSLLALAQAYSLRPGMADAASAPPGVRRTMPLMRRNQAAVVGLGGWGCRAIEDMRHFLGSHVQSDAQSKKWLAAVLESDNPAERIIGRYGEIPMEIIRTVDDVSWLRRDLIGVDVVVLVGTLREPNTVKHLPSYAREVLRLGAKPVVGIIEPMEIVNGELRRSLGAEPYACIENLKSFVNDLDLLPESFAAGARMHLNSIPDGSSLTDETHDAISHWHQAGTQLLGLFAAAALGRAENQFS